MAAIALAPLCAPRKEKLRTMAAAVDIERGILPSTIYTNTGRKTKQSQPIEISAAKKRTRSYSNNLEFRRNRDKDNDEIDGETSDLFETKLSRSTPAEHTAVTTSRFFQPQFPMPSTSLIRNRLSDNAKRICLRSFVVSRWNLSGTVLTSGAAAAGKRVFVRYTLDDWQTCCDVDAAYLDTDDVAGADRYHFRLDFPFRLPQETKMQMAVAASSFRDQTTNWDNNEGLNYIFTYKLHCCQ